MSITLLAPPELGISPAVDRPELLLRGRMILGDLLADGATGAADEARRLSEALLCDGTRALSGDFETGTLLRAQAIRELDEYLLIERVSARSPGEVLLSSLLEAGCSSSFLKSYGSLHAEQDLRLRRGLAA